MTYEETIEWLYSQLPMFSRIGAAAYKKDLHNTIALCDLIGNPQHQFRSVHIAGTNGKGSTSHMLAAIFQQAGYKTGLYTSPHIHDFRERIRINGQMINPDFVVSFTEKMKGACRDIEPSFFELTVAMAYDYFAKEQVDIAIIETGMGGRLDSTNVITPELSVITNIGFDHTSILGNTLELIATEKAGIIKPCIPAVVGETVPETKPVFENKAADVHAPLWLASTQYLCNHYHYTGEHLSCTVKELGTGRDMMISLDLVGTYQAKNLCTVLTAVDVLREKGFRLDMPVVRKALQQVKKLTGLKGRWDVISTNPTIILDVAHNEDGIRQVLQQLEEMYPAAHRHFVIGFVQDKDITSVLRLLNPADNYYFTQAHSPRALSHDVLKQKAEVFGLKGLSYDQVDEALSAAKNNAGNNDVIIVCGSFFVIAELSAY